MSQTPGLMPMEAALRFYIQCEDLKGDCSQLNSLEFEDLVANVGHLATSYATIHLDNSALREYIRKLEHAAGYVAMAESMTGLRDLMGGDGGGEA